MPTKRTKISRTAVLVTPHALELYQTGLRTQPHWDACHDACTINCTHPECDEYYEAFHALNMALSIRPHEPSPLYSYESIRSYGGSATPHPRIITIKQALDAALSAEESKP